MAVDPENPYGYNLVAEALMKHGARRRARPVLEQALKFQPSDLRLQQWMAQAQADPTDDEAAGIARRPPSRTSIGNHRRKYPPAAATPAGAASVRPTGYPDPTIVQTIPKPDFFFLWLYAMLALLPPEMETPALLIGPVIAIGFLILLPFLSGEGEKSWRRRPIAVVTLLLIAVSLATFTKLATYSPWSPIMDAWSGDPLPDSVLSGLTPLQRQGALVFQGKQCRNCHSVGGSGGLRGPSLDSVATKLTHDQLVRQVIQGGGNMPAYGRNLNPAEVTALVSFLETLRPPGRLPARDASRAAAQPTIIDKNARIGNNVVISPAGKPEKFDHELCYIRDGIVIIPKSALIPHGTVI